MLKLKFAFENHTHNGNQEGATIQALSEFDKIANTTIEKSDYYCNSMPLNIAFGFLIYSWLCIPVIIACQILHYQSVLSARELHENLKSKQQKNQVIEPFELEFKL